MAADLQLRQYSHSHKPPDLPYPTAWMGPIDTTDPDFQSLHEAVKQAVLDTQDPSSRYFRGRPVERTPTPAAAPGLHACRPPDHTSRPASHHLLRQEHLRTQRAAQAAWVAEQAQKISKETGPSQTSSTNNLRNLTPTQFKQDQKAVSQTMQDQSRPPPSPAAVPGLHACRPPDQASRPSSHQRPSQEHLRSQRAAQAAWVAEQAQKTGKETTGPSLSSSPSTHPDIIRVAKSRPMTEAAWLAWIEE